MTEHYMIVANFDGEIHTISVPFPFSFEDAVADIMSGEIENVEFVSRLQIGGQAPAANVTLPIAVAIDERLQSEGKLPHDTLRTWLARFGFEYPDEDAPRRSQFDEHNTMNKVQQGVGR